MNKSTRRMPKVPTSPRRNNNSSSWVWRYANKLNDVKYYCKLCAKELKHSGNTANVHVHLRRMHPKEFAEASAKGRYQGDCQGDYEDVVSFRSEIHIESVLDLDDVEPKEEEMEDKKPEVHKVDLMICEEEELGDSLQTDREEVSELISPEKIRPFVELVFKDLHSPSVILNEGFVQLMQSVNCSLPSADELNSALKNEYLTKCHQLAAMIDTAESVTISFHLWDLPSNKMCVTTTINFVAQPSCSPVSAVIWTKVMSSNEKLDLKIDLKLFRVYDKVTAIVQNGNRIVCLNAAQKLFKILCFERDLITRALNVVVEQLEISWCKNVIKYMMTNSDVSSSLSEKKALPLLPIKDNNFIDLYNTLDRFLNLKDCIIDISKR